MDMEGEKPQIISVKDTLDKVGLKPESSSAVFVSRLALLNEFTPIIRDEDRMVSYMERVFDQAEKKHRAFPPNKKNTIKSGALFADIGKSGPKEANIQQSKLILSMYSENNISEEYLNGPIKNFLGWLLSKYFENNENNTLKENVNGPVKNFLTNHLGSKEERLENAGNLLTSLGLNTDKLTMRDFFNLHTQWTYDLIKDSDLPKETIAAAVSHHRIRGDNPGIFKDDKSDLYIEEFGASARYGRAEKLVTMLDQYDAYRNRGMLNHKQTIHKLYELINTVRDGYYKNDSEFLEIIADIKISLKP